ncbi:MAG TPA: hypothetical protein VEN95_07645 [Actinomycetota bacterium]|nr:hypothetical protein [Actinomycetota bacterium]
MIKHRSPLHDSPHARFHDSTTREDMFAHDVHLILAWGTAFAVAGVVVEGAVRSVLGRGPGRLAEAGVGLVLVLIGMTAAAGLAKLVRGERPAESLHFLYAALAFGLIPVTDSFGKRASPRGKALIRSAGALVALGVLARLFATG